MGQILHGCAKTTEAIRFAIQNSQESLKTLARKYSINPKTVAKWKKRTTLQDTCMGPKEPSSTVLTSEEEAMCIAFRKHTLLSLDDCLYALQVSIPKLTRSSLHRLLQRHNVSRLPEVKGDNKTKKKFKLYPIGYFHIDIAEVKTEEGKLYLFVAIDRASKFVYVELLPRCLVPGCSGVYYKELPSREELWDKYYTAVPKRQRQYVSQSKIVKRA